MTTLEFTYENQFHAEITVQGGGWGELGSGPFNQLLADIWQLHATVPLTLFEVETEGPGALHYHLESQDGRHWHQVLTFDVMEDPGQTFTVNEPWRLSEFEHHRNLRDEVVRLHGRYTIQKIEVTVE